MFPVLSFLVTVFMLLCSFGVLQLNSLKILVLFLGLEKSDFFRWYEWFVLIVLICTCFLILLGEKHVINKYCFISKVTFYIWIYFVSFWNCLRPVVRLILKKNNPTWCSAFLLLEVFIVCSYDIKSARSNLWLPYLYDSCSRYELCVLIVAAWCWALQSRLAVSSLSALQ